jgi:hypothetical protein
MKHPNGRYRHSLDELGSGIEREAAIGSLQILGKTG